MTETPVAPVMPGTEPAPVPFSSPMTAPVPVLQKPVPSDADMTPVYPTLKQMPPKPVEKPGCGQPGCDEEATHQFQRRATPAEAAAHWDAMEQSIQADVPGYVQNRDDEVLISEFRCDHPDHASPVYQTTQTKEEN